jgi:hypothetical protein
MAAITGLNLCKSYKMAGNFNNMAAFATTMTLPALKQS